MSNIALSSGVSQNLLALQQTTSEASKIQNELATGKKVNSALDNPSSYFTSQSLTARAGDLSNLLDSISQAVQTLNAADQGITSLTSLVQSAKSIATQAEQSAKGTVNYTNIVGSSAIAVDTSQVTGTGSVLSSSGGGLHGATASVQGSLAINTANISNASDGNLLTISNGTATKTFEYQTSSTETPTTGDAQFTNAATLEAAVSAAFSPSSNNTSVSVSNGTITLQSSVAQDYATNYTATGTAALTNLTTQTTAVSGDTLTINDGTHTSTFRYVTTAGVAASGTFSDAADLVGAIAASNVSDITGTATGTGSNYLTLSAAKTVAITVGGNLGTDLGFGTTAVSDNYNSTLAGLSGTLTVGVGNDTVNTLTFGSAFGQISTATDLTNQLADITDITGSINSSNKIDFSPQSSANVTIGGTSSVVTGLGLTAGTTTPTSQVATANATRESLQTQYNDLLTQIDQLAGDSSYNGLNLLSGDNLKVTFNETGTSSLTIAGVSLNSAGLGLTSITGTGFQDNNVINNTLNTIDTAINTLRSQASTFGSNLSTVQTRQDFTNNLINVLQTGSNDLVLGDSNAEGADLLALQTRQQLSTTALSLSAQSDQAVLKLFGG